LTLEEKENQARQIIKKGLEEARNPFVLFDGRAESLVVLHLLRHANGGKIPIPVLHIDTTAEFKELYQYIEKMSKLWGFRLIRESNEEALNTIKFAEDKEKCCSTLKITAMGNAIKKFNIDRLFAFEDGIIKKNMDLFTIDIRNIILNPVQDFSVEEIWNYIKKYNLPYCSLYDIGYEYIQCIPCTDPVKPKDESIVKHEEEEIKKRLKALGYM
jgi:phosphoadenosine phosphosulfate reductase